MVSSMKRSRSINIKGGPAVNNWFAEQMVKDYGPEEVRERCCGPMLEAVEQVIANMSASLEKSNG